MKYSQVKMVVFVPTQDADHLRSIIGAAGAGHIGNYSHCSFSSRGYSRFKPLKNSNPEIGEIGILEKIEEERIEFICSKDEIQKVIAKIKEHHPYEEVAIDVHPLLEI